MNWTSQRNQQAVWKGKESAENTTIVVWKENSTSAENTTIIVWKKNIASAENTTIIVWKENPLALKILQL